MSYNYYHLPTIDESPIDSSATLSTMISFCPESLPEDPFSAELDYIPIELKEDVALDGLSCSPGSCGAHGLADVTASAQNEQLRNNSPNDNIERFLFENTMQQRPSDESTWAFVDRSGSLTPAKPVGLEVQHPNLQSFDDQIFAQHDLAAESLQRDPPMVSPNGHGFKYIKDWISHQEKNQLAGSPLSPTRPFKIQRHEQKPPNKFRSSKELLADEAVLGTDKGYTAIAKQSDHQDPSVVHDTPDSPLSFNLKHSSEYYSELGTVSITLRMQPTAQLADRTCRKMLAVKLDHMVYQFGESVQDSLPSVVEIAKKGTAVLETEYYKYLQESEELLKGATRSHSTSESSACSECNSDSELSDVTSDPYTPEDAQPSMPLYGEKKPQIYITGERMTPFGREYRVARVESWMSEGSILQGQEAVRSWKASSTVEVV